MADYRAAAEAVLDRAQAEGRNVTEAEEIEYLDILRLRAIEDELNTVKKELFGDDESDA